MSKKTVTTKQVHVKEASSDTITRLESEVRTYSRQWPTVFSRAQGSLMYSEDDQEYIDLFAGAGALNYGHNDSDMVKAMVEYLTAGNIVHGLDMFTTAKAQFLRAFEKNILAPRSLPYKVQFTGPTGTNAVEAALKVARKVTGRTDVVHFTNSFHGVSLGALAMTGNSAKRKGGGVPLNYQVTAPFDGYTGGVDGITWLDNALHDPSSGLDKPAAVIIETVQGEGGINVASAEWLQRLRALCTKHDVLLIVDDVQMGCGRTGKFFSFEFAQIVPDIVVLSKSISGAGQPMALTLIKPEYDIWSAGEHNGTFRGNNLAFVSATVAIEKFWKNDNLERKIAQLHNIIADKFSELSTQYMGQLVYRGRGLAMGIEFMFPDVANEIAHIAYEQGVVVETCGPNDEVIKILPALTIEKKQLIKGLEILSAAIAQVLNRQAPEHVPTS